jgi:3-hydroxyacyl-CoA dehydrogenase
MLMYKPSECRALLRHATGESVRIDRFHLPRHRSLPTVRRSAHHRGEKMSVCSYQTRGDVAVIRMDSPPVNGLGLELRKGIADGLAQAAADASIKAVVLTGTDKAFSGGADIREFNSPKMTATPSLHDIIDTLDAGGKPVVAAIAGVALGGGLELALGCHYRVARGDAQIALP